MSIELSLSVFDFVGENFTAILATVVGGAILVRLARRFKPTRAQRRHKKNQKRSYLDLAKLREIGPIENPGRCFNWLRKVDPYRFEEIILSELDRRKLKIERNKSYSGDGGVDGRFYMDGELWLVQAKRYKAFVKTEHVAEFAHVCEQHKARGLFVHTGRTPKELLAQKRQMGVVRIISGHELMQLFAGQAVALSTKPAGRLAQPVSAAGIDISPIGRGRPDHLAGTGEAFDLAEAVGAGE